MKPGAVEKGRTENTVILLIYQHLVYIKQILFKKRPVPKSLVGKEDDKKCDATAEGTFHDDIWILVAPKLCIGMSFYFIQLVAGSLTDRHKSLIYNKLGKKPIKS